MNNLTFHPIISSNLESAAHDEATGNVFVRFKTKPGRPQPTYEYPANMSAEDFAKWQKSFDDANVSSYAFFKEKLAPLAFTKHDAQPDK